MSRVTVAAGGSEQDDAASVTQNDFSVVGGMLAGGTMAVMTVLFSWLAFRFPRVQPILEGDPVVLVEHGKTIDRNLRSNRITLEELAAQARLQQIAHIEDVEWACSRPAGRSASFRRALPRLSGCRCT
jgi:uncharacterized membrane protein YcaP (DUF421 family)